jgi:hypothetical protein
MEDARAIQAALEVSSNERIVKMITAVATIVSLQLTSLVQAIQLHFP